MAYREAENPQHGSHFLQGNSTSSNQVVHCDITHNFKHYLSEWFRTNDHGAGIALVFFRFYAPLTRYLIIRAAFLPRILGVLWGFRHNKVFSCALCIVVTGRPKAPDMREVGGPSLRRPSIQLRMPPRGLQVPKDF
jgi:hypothetical protein